MEFHVTPKKIQSNSLKINFGTVFILLIPNGIKPVMFNLKKIKTMFTFATQPFKSIFDDPIWKDLEKTIYSFDYDSEKTDDEYLLELPVPGLSKEDLSVKIINGKLEVKGGKENHKWTPKFEKTFLLPKDINTKKVEASVENGILTVKIGLNKESETIVKII